MATFCLCGYSSESVSSTQSNVTEESPIDNKLLKKYDKTYKLIKNAFEHGKYISPESCSTLVDLIKHKYYRDGEAYMLLAQIKKKFPNSCGPNLKTIYLSGVIAFPNNPEFVDSLFHVIDENKPNCVEQLQIAKLVISKCPQNKRIDRFTCLKADALMGLGRYEEAISAYSDVEKMRPDLAGLVNSSRANIELNKAIKAEQIDSIIMVYCNAIDYLYQATEEAKDSKLKTGWDKNARELTSSLKSMVLSKLNRALENNQAGAIPMTFYNTIDYLGQIAEKTKNSILKYTLNEIARESISKLKSTFLADLNKVNSFNQVDAWAYLNTIANLNQAKEKTKNSNLKKALNEIVQKSIFALKDAGLYYPSSYDSPDTVTEYNITMEEGGTILSHIPLDCIGNVRKLTIKGLLYETDLRIINNKCQLLEYLDLSKAVITYSPKHQKAAQDEREALAAVLGMLGTAADMRYRDGNMSSLSYLQAKTLEELGKDAADIKSNLSMCILPPKSIYNKIGLHTLKLPYRLSYIYDGNFTNCYSLVNIEWPLFLDKIDHSFDKCGIKELRLPDSVTRVWGFENCPNLTLVDLRNTKTTINLYLGDEHGPCTIYYPETVTTCRKNGGTGHNPITIFYTGKMEACTDSMWDCTIHFKSKEAPNCNRYDITRCKIYIPKGSITSYYTEMGSSNTYIEE